MAGGKGSAVFSKLEMKMKKIKKLGHLLVLLIVISIFFFSIYKIAALTGLGRLNVFGFNCDICNDCFCDICDDCGPCCPTPTEEPEPTPTEELSPSPTPIEELSPTPTLTPIPTPTLPSESGNGDSANGDVGGASAPVCGEEKPGTPILTSLEKISGDQTKLTWTTADRATGYSIAYGLSSGNYQFGLDDTGLVNQFAIGGLDAGVNYCFVVRANNNCQPGDFSNELCQSQPSGWGGDQVLGASTLAATGSSLNDFIFNLNTVEQKAVDWFNLTVFDRQLPERIVIDDLKIDLPVNLTKLRDGQWPVAASEANFLLGSTLPGQSGNGIFYAHNKNNLFGSLNQIKPGNDITVVTPETNYTYEVFEILTAERDDLSILEKGDGQIITLFTCTGPNDSQRLVVKAKLKQG